MRGLMPGKVLKAKLTDSSLEPAAATIKMGVCKLTFLGDASPTKTTKPTTFWRAIMVRRFFTGYTPARVQPVAKCTSLESPELEHYFTTLDRATSATDTISEDDATSVFTSSTRTSNTISDDDGMSRLPDFAVCTTSADFIPARHSTACCTDAALRRELWKKFGHAELTLDETPNIFSDSYAMGHSFRRDPDSQDRVESLALWEETEMRCTISSRDRNISKDMLRSSHSDKLASSTSGSNTELEPIFRKPKKASSNFFNGFFSGLPFSAARRSRKSS